jgi:flagellar basal-body rod protein FlgC
MDYNPAFAISAAGMNLERTRVDVAALNLANAHTTQAAGEAGYTPMRVVARPAAPGASFAALMQAGETATAALNGLLPGVSVEPTGTSARQVHEPGHPMADARGFVSYPGVDPATEMVGLMSATRAYEANVAAMNTARALALKALDIGGTS